MSLGVNERSPFAFDTLTILFGPVSVDVEEAADVVLLPEEPLPP